MFWAYRKNRLYCRHCEERSDEAIQPFSAARLDCFAALAMTELIMSRQTADMLDDAGEIHPTMAGGVERLVDFLRMPAERRRGAGGVGGILRQSEVLHHQRGGET